MAKSTIIQQGEVNTAANVGAGVGLYQTKLGAELQFRSLLSLSQGLAIAISGSGDEVELSLNNELDASCLTTDNVGDLVYFTGVKVAGKYQVTTADPTDISKMPAVAVILSKSTLVDCKIQMLGGVEGIFGGLTPGKRCFVNLSGNITQDPSTITPSVAGYAIIQDIGVATSDDSVILDPFSVYLKRIYEAGSGRKPLAINYSEGLAEEMAPTDSMELGGLDLSGDLDMGSNNITNLADGVNPNDAVNLSQLQSVSSGLDPKAAVRAATTAALPSYSYAANVLTASSNGALPAIDTVTLIVNDRVLLKDESGANEKYNGIYEVTQVGDGSTPWKLTRTTDADTDAEVNPGMAAAVSEGSAHVGQIWILVTPEPITLNTTGLEFSLWQDSLNIVDGDGLSFSGVTLNVNTGDGIAIVSDDVVIDLATDPGLQFVLGKLEAKIDSTGGLQKTSSGLAVKIDSTPPTLSSDSNGLKVIGVPSEFYVDGDQVSTTVDADALDTITGGPASNADSYHTHASVGFDSDTILTGRNLGQVLVGRNSGNVLIRRT